MDSDGGEGLGGHPRVYVATKPRNKSVIIITRRCNPHQSITCLPLVPQDGRNASRVTPGVIRAWYSTVVTRNSGHHHSLAHYSRNV